jgi:hypothetical protein
MVTTNARVQFCLSEINRIVRDLQVGFRAVLRDDNGMPMVCITRYEHGWTVMEDMCGSGASHYTRLQAIVHILRVCRLNGYHS